RDERPENALAVFVYTVASMTCWRWSQRGRPRLRSAPLQSHTQRTIRRKRSVAAYWPMLSLRPDPDHVGRRSRRGLGIGVCNRLGPGDELVEVIAVDQPPGERIAGRASLQPVDRQFPLTGRQHEVSEPAALQHGRVRDDAGMSEDLPQRRDPGPGVRERPA